MTPFPPLQPYLCSRHIGMAEQFLDGADIVTSFQEASGKRVCCD